MKKITLSACALLLALVVYTGCDISNNAVTVPPAGFYLIHASPNAPNLDIYGGSGALLADNYAYKRDTGYYIVTATTYQLKIAETGTANFLVSSNVTLNPNTYYSIFIIDSLSKMKLAAVYDGIKTPGTDTAEVRFLQFSPNLAYMNAALYNATDTMRFSGRSFNDQEGDTLKSAFKPIKGGTYTLGLFNPGSGTPFTEFPGIPLVAGKNFTVYLRGFYGGTGVQALDTGMIQHTR